MLAWCRLVCSLLLALPVSACVCGHYTVTLDSDKDGPADVCGVDVMIVHERERKDVLNALDVTQNGGIDKWFDNNRTREKLVDDHRLQHLNYKKDGSERQAIFDVPRKDVDFYLLVVVNPLLRWSVAKETEHEYCAQESVDHRTCSYEVDINTEGMPNISVGR